jgi:hypothetical protein
MGLNLSRDRRSIIVAIRALSAIWARTGVGNKRAAKATTRPGPALRLVLLLLGGDREIAGIRRPGGLFRFRSRTRGRHSFIVDGVRLLLRATRFGALRQAKVEGRDVAQVLLVEIFDPDHSVARVAAGREQLVELVS